MTGENLFSRLYGLGFLLGVVLAATIGTPASAQEQKFFRIATGSPSGIYFSIGTIIAGAISNPTQSQTCEDPEQCGVPGLLAVAQTTQGTVENLYRIQAGEIESGFAQSNIAFRAFHGDGRFVTSGKLDKLRVIARLYPEAVHLVSWRDSEIKSVKDLRGHPVSLGPKGSGTVVDATAILLGAGLSLKDIKPKYHASGGSADLMRQGRINAFFIVGGTPVQAISDLTDDLQIDLVPIEGELAAGLLRGNPFFHWMQLEAGTYPGIGAVDTLGVNALWLVSEDQSTDLIYNILTAFWNKNTRRRLDEGHPMGRQIQLETALLSSSVPLHPGAEKFYRERGILR